MERLITVQNKLIVQEKINKDLIIKLDSMEKETSFLVIKFKISIMSCLIKTAFLLKFQIALIKRRGY